MLFSIVYALVPKGDDTSSISDESETSQQQDESEGTTAPGEDGIIADESGPETTDPDSRYYTDDQAEAEGYANDADDADDASDGNQGRGVGDNPWSITCPSDSRVLGVGCVCRDDLVGTPGSCTAAPVITVPPITNPPGTPTITLKSSQPFSPAKTYKAIKNSRVVEIPTGTTVGPTTYDIGTKFDIVEQQEYSNGKKFLLVKSQKDHGSKQGFIAENMQVFVKPVVAQPTGPTIKKVLVFMMENKTYANAKANMPYTTGLVNKTGVVYTNSWSAGEWKSLPNYIALAGGSNFGITSDEAKPINGRSIFGLAASNNKTVKSYTEDQSKNCQKHKHNPWTYFTPDKATCKQFDVPFKANFQADINAGKLPKVGFVSPNAKNNGHDTDAKHADAFFKQWMNVIMQGPDWKSGNLAVIMTYDEAKLRAQKEKPGQILTTLYHPALANRGSRSINTHIQHYSITRLWAEVAGVWVNNPSINITQLKAPGNSNVQNATSMVSQLGLTPDTN